MNIVRLSSPQKSISGTVEISGSKSESNRALILQSLSENKFPIKGLSTANDTVCLQQLLQQFKEGEKHFNAGDAGTAFRFFTAFLATQEGQFTVTGSSRMKNRPIAPLVDAFNELGAIITYIDKTGFPPLKIQGNSKIEGGEIVMNGSISSQFSSALIMVAPDFSKGLKLTVTQQILSLPYLDMTIQMMNECGVKVLRKGNVIFVSSGNYNKKEMAIEPDWSSLSYWYSLAVLSEEFNMFFPGFNRSSMQADTVISEICEEFGVDSVFKNGGVSITKHNIVSKHHFVYDFKLCPDIAQTLMVICAGLRITCKLTGLNNLNMKESERIETMATELRKTGALIQTSKSSFEITGYNRKNTLWEFDTHDDHRVAMSLTSLCLLKNEIIIRNPEVVNKSYPNFWEDLASYLRSR